MPVATNDSARDTVLEQILQRSATDRAFRARLISEPDTAIEETIGVPLPKTMRVRFIVKDAHIDQLVVLPEFQAPDAQVSDAELGITHGEWCITSCGLSFNCDWTINMCPTSCYTTNA